MVKNFFEQRFILQLWLVVLLRIEGKETTCGQRLKLSYVLLLLGAFVRTSDWARPESLPLNGT